MDLPQLQNLIKRDPESYRDEFDQQRRHYEAALRIFRLQPSQPSEEFANLVGFLSHVLPCYPGVMPSFVDELMDLLESNATSLEPDLRRSVVSALILLRNRGVIDATKLLPLFFVLFKVQDKLLRQQLRSHIINDVCKMNQKHMATKTNATLENFLSNLIEGDHPIAAKESLFILIELFRRNVWNDARAANLISLACMSPHARVAVSALTFFIGEDEADNHGANDSDSDDEADVVVEQRDYSRHSKSGKKKLKEQERKGTKRKREKKSGHGNPNISAMQLLHDPQTLAEKLFSHVRKTTARFEVRMMLLNLISRLISLHGLILLNFYPFLQRYLQPHQRYITQILAIAAQSCHDLVPPDAVQPVIRQICDNFVSERCTTAVMAVGLNAIRIICSRTPLAMDATLLHDLVQYKKTKDKGVMMAARSLLQLYRKLDPSLLHRKQRGKPGEGIGIAFGDRRVEDGEKYVKGEESEESGEEMEESEESGEEMEESEEESDESEESDDDAPSKRYEIDTDAAVLMHDITGPMEHRKAGKLGRIETMMAGKEDRTGFGIAARKAEKGGGTTNMDKSKHKVYQMVRFGRRASQQRRQKNTRHFRKKGRQFKGKKAWKS